MAKIIQFQYESGILHVLDEDGKLWVNMDLRSALGWKPVPGPIDNTGEPDPEENDDMNGQETQKLLGFLEHIARSAAQLVDIEQQRLQLELSMTADTVTQLVNAITTLIQADANDQAARKTAEDALKALQDQDASLNDPALQASVDAALAAAAAAGQPAQPNP